MIIYSDKSSGIYNITGLTKNDLMDLSNVIDSAPLPIRRTLFPLKNQIEFSLKEEMKHNPKKNVNHGTKKV